MYTQVENQDPKKLDIRKNRDLAEKFYQYVSEWNTSVVLHSESYSENDFVIWVHEEGITDFLTIHLSNASLSRFSQNQWTTWAMLL